MRKRNKDLSDLHISNKFLGKVSHFFVIVLLAKGSAIRSGWKLKDLRVHHRKAQELSPGEENWDRRL